MAGLERQIHLGRAIRAYDVYREREARKIKEAADNVALEAYRNRQVTLSQAGMQAAIRLLEKSVARLITLDASDIKPGQLPAFFRAAAHVAEVSGNAEATALGLDELSALLEDNNASD